MNDVSHPHLKCRCFGKNEVLLKESGCHDGTSTLDLGQTILLQGYLALSRD